VAEPWGANFAYRNRTIVINLAMSDEQIADAAVKLMKTARSAMKPKVPSWDQVTTQYMNRLYKTALSR
jgi:Xaa-Pro aminopeptidase